jgi:hypothetical protein
MNSYKPLDIDQIEVARENSRIGKKIVLYKSTMGDPQDTLLLLL